ncbi:uncharacterized protein LACBIDRAFT_312722 [Laccaria bicolor S238N-H82]|uniref:Predicted protein n=1 Tax=Laccaria bicolor (strain S238N-H82 / ATCC MYA-4686) TaxID=486041 RepID=B0DWT3_LACBS|nr:uncharacterized protein LACBIDRAFT_312722 [Laccaria bicolor S238N-H82]EDR00984.1 predicted protein [Laccaria bicolor S238N-H82]|eukprot:XP_001888379.1 predicted protein [Laccaria bicolor S238N-H82]
MRVDSKYNNETFMSSNKIGGFFNPLEASRRYLFGSVGVLGQMNDSVISGALSSFVVSILAILGRRLWMLPRYQMIVRHVY